MAIRIIVKRILLGLLFLLSSFCYSTPLRKLTVSLDSVLNPNHAPLIIAKQQHYFEQMGLDVHFIGPFDQINSALLIANKKADVGIATELDFMKQIDQGLPIIHFGTLIDKPLLCFVALQDSGIQSITDLKGKQIGSMNNTLSHAMLKAVMEKQGLTENDVQVINIHNSLSQALLSHKIDVINGMTRNFDIPNLERNGKELTVFFPEEYGAPNYSELIFITHTNNAHDNRLLPFLLAVKKAVAYLDQHPKEAWQDFIKMYPNADNTMNKEAWFATIPYFAEDPLMVDFKEWENFTTLLLQNRLIRKKYDVSTDTVSLNRNIE